MPDDHPTSSSCNYPGDCEFTAALLQQAANRNEDKERGYLWRNCLPRAKKIKLLLLDVDGILTDGSLFYTADNTEIKAFNSKDGFGLNMIRDAGVETGIITARTSRAVEKRAADLKVSHVYQGTRDKLQVFDQILSKSDIQPEEVAYMGDDWLDLPLLIRVGFAATVADASREIKNVAHYVTRGCGGHGAVREVCDLIIDAKGLHLQLLEKYMQKK